MPKSRRRILSYVGSGLALGTAGVYGIRQSTQTASAEVALAFEDADVELPEDRSIEDLRIVGEITGDYHGGERGVHSVGFTMEAEFDRFGEFGDSREFSPDQNEGTVSWEPSKSLVEETEFDPDNHLDSPNFSADKVSYNLSVVVKMGVMGAEQGDIIAEAQTGDSATITFHQPSNSNDGGNGGGGGGGGGEDTDTPDASVEITFGFEVDK